MGVNDINRGIALVVILATQTDVFDANSTSESPEQNLLESTSDNPDSLAFECLDHSGLSRHDHAWLRIYIDERKKEMPSPIGINTGVCNEQGQTCTLCTFTTINQTTFTLNPMIQ